MKRNIITSSVDLMPPCGARRTPSVFSNCAGSIRGIEAFYYLFYDLQVGECLYEVVIQKFVIYVLQMTIFQ